MSRRVRTTTAVSEPGSFLLSSSSAVSLHDRFTQLLVGQQTQSMTVTFDPTLLQQRQVFSSQPMVVLVKDKSSLLLGLQDSVSEQVPAVPRSSKQHLRSRSSVWTRLGWQQVTRRLSTSKPCGFWSFRNKYSWGARSTSTHRRRRCPSTRLGLKNTNIQKLTAGRHLPRDGDTALKGWGQSRWDILTKKQLDEQLDEYMSKSRQRLDAELDNYMSMAGDAQLQWG